MASGGPGGPLALPWAAQQQGETIAADYALAEYVRLRRLAVVWWWGERKLGAWHGAFCYVCAQPITEWDTRYPITREAQAAIREHSAGHVAGGVTTLASRTSAERAGDDAPPAGGQS